MARMVTANELRWLGEEADGKRGDQHVLVWRKDKRGKEKLALAVKGKLDKGDVPVNGLEVQTDYEGGGLRGDATIILRIDGRDIPIPDADCVFVTQSAFAKFVIPYYTRFRSPAQIGWMKTKFFQDDYIGVAHFPPSEEMGIEEASAENGGPDDAPKTLAAVSKFSGVSK